MFYSILYIYLIGCINLLDENIKHLLIKLTKLYWYQKFFEIMKQISLILQEKHGKIYKKGILELKERKLELKHYYSRIKVELKTL